MQCWEKMQERCWDYNYYWYIAKNHNYFIKGDRYD
jgi:hypothetical protein